MSFSEFSRRCKERWPVDPEEPQEREMTPAAPRAKKNAAGWASGDGSSETREQIHIRAPDLCERG
jgi:hypothetical protein